MSKIYLEEIWAEDIFKWYYESVTGEGGDGAACIVCKNYKQAAEWFIEWWTNKYKSEIISRGYHGLKDKEFLHPKDEYEGIINYHDANENFMFSQTPTKGFHGEYDFIIKKDCPFAKASPEEGKKLTSI